MRIMLILLFCSPCLFASALDKQSNCRPKVDASQSQWVVGYGSLMQEHSKQETAQRLGENHPIYLTGYKRGWVIHGSPVGFSTTYLAVTKQPGQPVNAVYFQVFDAKDIKRFDERESGYCREAILAKHMKSAAHEALPAGQYWIYVSPNSGNEHPSKHYPIVQSYVDLFLSGCLELEEKYHLQGFSRDCILTTSFWSVHWVNDRVHPRRASDDEPYAAKIDMLIASMLPGYFKQIRIE